MAGKFEIFKDKRGEYRFHLKASNGEVIASSEGYKTKASAENGIKSVQTNAPDATGESPILGPPGSRARLLFGFS
jgi:uncharacterized protein YegP (UPF0339 family)